MKIFRNLIFYLFLGFLSLNAQKLGIGIENCVHGATISINFTKNFKNSHHSLTIGNRYLLNYYLINVPGYFARYTNYHFSQKRGKELIQLSVSHQDKLINKEHFQMYLENKITSGWFNAYTYGWIGNSYEKHILNERFLLELQLNLGFRFPLNKNLFWVTSLGICNSFADFDLEKHLDYYFIVLIDYIYREPSKFFNGGHFYYHNTGVSTFTGIQWNF